MSLATGLIRLFPPFHFTMDTKYFKEWNDLQPGKGVSTGISSLLLGQFTDKNFSCYCMVESQYALTHRY